jgi:proteic killer suppression protein
MIKSFKDKEAELIWDEEFSKKLPIGIQRTALRKLLMLNSASNLNDLKALPSNCLEKLCGTRIDYYSIRINIQWRIVFRFKNGDAFEIAIVDYH